MVQQIVTLCDVCYDDEVEAKAATHLVAVAGGTWSLELCPKHYDALVAPLADVAERLGQVVKDMPLRAKGTGSKPAGAPGNRSLSEPCLICGHTVPTSPAMTMHIKKLHGLRGIGEAYGLTCPLCNHEAGNATSAGKHVSAAHPEVGVGVGMPEAFRYAAEHGDPHDVVAKRLAHHGLDAMPPRVVSAVTS